jgi:hypothetical protein
MSRPQGPVGRAALRTVQLALTAAALISLCGCATFHFYQPALVEGAIISAITGEPVAGARASFQTRAGDPITTAPVVITGDDGRFRAGGRKTRRLVGWEMMEAIESKNPVTLRIEADGYETRLLDVEGRKRYRAPIKLVPLPDGPAEESLL